jgi:hypothetical protein
MYANTLYTTEENESVVCIINLLLIHNHTN